MNAYDTFTFTRSETAVFCKCCVSCPDCWASNSGWQVARHVRHFHGRSHLRRGALRHPNSTRWFKMIRAEKVRECQGDWKQRMWSQRSWTPGHIQTHPDTSIHPRPPLARITWALLPAELLSCAVLRCQSLEVTRDFPSILWKDWSRIRVGQHNNNTPTCMCIV